MWTGEFRSFRRHAGSTVALQKSLFYIYGFKQTAPPIPTSKMATKQTIDFFSRFKDDLKGPVLEIGALVMDGYVQYLPKDIHGSSIPEDYVGIDIFPGKGVDHVINLAKPDEVAKLPFRKFKTIHAHYVFEHVTDIFHMAKVVEDLLEEDGVLLFSVPFVWRIHRIPVDMWRFTPQGIDFLFPTVEFIDNRCGLHTRNGDKFHPIKDKLLEFDLGSGLKDYPWHLKLMVKTFRRLGLYPEIFDERRLLFESNLLMYGIKRSQPTYTYIDPKYI